MELKSSNPKAFAQINLKLNALAGIETRVGWFKESTYANGTPVALAAAAAELGNPNARFPAPPRPFMRPTMIKKKKEWALVAAISAREMLKGNLTATQAMQTIGERAQGDIYDAITEVTEPPLSPVTIELRAMKKRDRSLEIRLRQVYEAIRKVNTPGYKTPNVSTKPLNDSGLMLATLTNVTVDT